MVIGEILPFLDLFSSSDEAFLRLLFAYLYETRDRADGKSRAKQKAKENPNRR
jgi:hypothetical protein